jgi:hypothetical protein
MERDSLYVLDQVVVESELYLVLDGEIILDIWVELYM